MNKKTGVIAAVVSAVIFGFVPILGKLSFDGGSNAVTLTFLRSTISLPLLFAILLVKKIPVGLSKSETRDILIYGIFGSAATMLLLSESYHYIPAGLATTLHFIYPAVVVLADVLIFKSKLGKGKIIALMLVIAGILLFLSIKSGVSLPGMLLAAGSGLTYSFYIIGIERSSLSGMHYFKLSFYLCIIAAVLSCIMGLYSGSLTFALTPSAWLYSAVISLSVSVGAISLFQIGVVRVGAPTASILSTLEPITGVVMGALILGENIPPVHLAGTLLIFSGVVTAAVTQFKTQEPAGQQI